MTNPPSLPKPSSRRGGPKSKFRPAVAKAMRKPLAENGPAKPGKVYLVGAGPGDPGLMTLRGAEVLKNADAVVYDNLASFDFLDMAKPNAKVVYAGKTGSNHSMSQEAINDLLVRLGQSGLSVVRLKGGDPYIFGRGGEEALALFEAKIPFEVVPGVSSAVAAPAAAGIPLTHRDLSSQAVILTGHEKPGKAKSSHDWEALAKMGTLSIVMGAENLSKIAELLIEGGKPPDTPAALIQWGTTPKQKVASAPLGSIAAAAEKAGLGPPAVLVVGKVAELRSRLSWFEKRPLFGKKIMVTRARAQASKLSAAFRDLGAKTLERPLIEIFPLQPEKSLNWRFEKLSSYSWLILTSPNGAEVFLKALFSSGRDARALACLKIAVIGPGTAESLSQFGLKADLTPESFVAEGRAQAFEALNEPSKGSCLLPRAKAARDVLQVELEKLGYKVDAVPIYATIPASLADGLSVDLLLGDPPDLTTLTSSSTAESLAQIIAPEDRRHLPIASIGPITSKTARELGFNVVVESPVSTIPALAEAAVEYLANLPEKPRQG